jgi:hypothetical protein
MKIGIAISIVSALSLTVLVGSADAASTCTASAKVGGLCACKVLELRPTQLAVGMIEVKAKEADLSSKKPSKLDAYLKKNPEPVVRGPGGALFITDHHHLARAAADQRIETTYCKVDADYSRLDPGSFWGKMAEQHWVYLYDENVKGPHDPADLPTSVEGLKDDPYRSLAGAVRRNGGFGKVSAPFAEFIWADFFRPRIPITDIEGNYKNAVENASIMAKTLMPARCPVTRVRPAGSR